VGISYLSVGTIFQVGVFGVFSFVDKCWPCGWNQRMFKSALRHLCW